VTIDRQGLDEFVKKHGFIGWYETSAQEDINIGMINNAVPILLLGCCETLV
jgi:hypothetical protein